MGNIKVVIHKTLTISSFRVWYSTRQCGIQPGSMVLNLAVWYSTRQYGTQPGSMVFNPAVWYSTRQYGTQPALTPLRTLQYT